MSLEALSNEVLDMIIDLTPYSELDYIALTSKRLYAVCVPRLKDYNRFRRHFRSVECGYGKSHAAGVGGEPLIFFSVYHLLAYVFRDPGIMRFIEFACLNMYSRSMKPVIEDTSDPLDDEAVWEAFLECENRRSYFAKSLGCRYDRIPALMCHSKTTLEKKFKWKRFLKLAAQEFDFAEYGTDPEAPMAVLMLMLCFLPNARFLSIDLDCADEGMWKRSAYEKALEKLVRTANYAHKRGQTGSLSKVLRLEVHWEQRDPLFHPLLELPNLKAANFVVPPSNKWIQSSLPDSWINGFESLEYNPDLVQDTAFLRLCDDASSLAHLTYGLAKTGVYTSDLESVDLDYGHTIWDLEGTIANQLETLCLHDDSARAPQISPQSFSFALFENLRTLAIEEICVLSLFITSPSSRVQLSALNSLRTPGSFRGSVLPLLMAPKLVEFCMLSKGDDLTGMVVEALFHNFSSETVCASLKRIVIASLAVTDPKYEEDSHNSGTSSLRASREYKAASHKLTALGLRFDLISHGEYMRELLARELTRYLDET